MFRHPGPLGFQLVADTLAWSLTASIVKGCEMLESGADVSAKVPLMLESALPEHECKATGLGPFFRFNSPRVVVLGCLCCFVYFIVCFVFFN